MDRRNLIRFSMWNLLWAVAAAGILCAVMKYTMPGKRIVSAVIPLVVGIPVIAGALLRGAWGMCYGLCIGLALLILVVGVVLLLMAFDINIGPI